MAALSGQQTYTYTAALARVEALRRAEGDPRINPVCRGFALTHGARTARASLLLHGYTNCPQQLRRFAALLHARGQNVYVPRLPHHGLADRMSPDHAGITARLLLQTLDEGLAIAHALGERVAVAGLSAGGVLAAYAAQHRPDVEWAVVIAPVLGAPSVNPYATLPLALLSRLLPNQFRWWDPLTKDARDSPSHCYPRFSTRALGAIVRLGYRVLTRSRWQRPAAREIVVVTNGGDEAVTLPPIERLITRWRARGGNVRQHHFPKELGLIHDLMDPAQRRQQVELVYPVLLDLIDP